VGIRMGKEYNSVSWVSGMLASNLSDNCSVYSMLFLETKSYARKVSTRTFTVPRKTPGAFHSIITVIRKIPCSISQI